MSNITTNRVNVVMTPVQISNIKGLISQIIANLPATVGLTVDERISIPKINVSNKIFTEDAINAAVNNASLLPAYFNTANMQNDLTYYTQLDELILLMNQTLEKMTDTQMIAGSEAYVSALTAYKLFGSAADAGIPGTDAIYDQLKERFAQTATTSSPVTPP